MSQNSFDSFRIPSDLRSSVYCTAIRLGTDSDWKFLWTRYYESTVPSEQAIILFALGCSRDVWILARYLDWILDETSRIRKQDCAAVFHAVAVNDIGFHLAKQFLEDRIEDIHQ